MIGTIDELQDRLLKADAANRTQDYWFAVMQTMDGFDQLETSVRHAIADVCFFADFENPGVCKGFDYYINQIALNNHPACMEGVK